MIFFLLLHSSASGTLLSTSGTLHKPSTSGAQHSISCEENSLYTLLSHECTDSHFITFFRQKWGEVGWKTVRCRALWKTECRRGTDSGCWWKWRSIRQTYTEEHRHKRTSLTPNLRTVSSIGRVFLKQLSAEVKGGAYIY